MANIPKVVTAIPIKTGRITAHVSQMEGQAEVIGVIEFQPISDKGEEIGRVVVLADLNGQISEDTLKLLQGLFEGFRQTLDAAAY